MQLTAALHAALPAPPPDGGAPTWVHLVPAGTFRGTDGRGPYTVANAAALIAASLPEGQRLPIDENHATDHGAASGVPAPARGWIVALEARADGVWGQVEWTPTGAALLAERAYRGISPVFVHTKGGEVRRLLRAALTNAPNLAQLATLHTQQEPPLDLTQLRAALGLDAGADEAAIIAAAQAAQAAIATHAEATRRLAEAARLPKPAEAGVEEIITALQAQWGGDASLRTELVALQTQLETLRAAAARDKAVAAVDGAIRAGKPITPALREHYIARHAQDPASVETELAALPSLHAGGLAGHAPPPSGSRDPREIAQAALALQSQRRAAGQDISFAEAVTALGQQEGHQK